MEQRLVKTVVAAQCWYAVAWHRLVKDEDGEGVISAAIAVLIMSFLGALMWFGFKAIWGDTETNTRAQVNQIGS